ncbi:MAG: hypothetical protein CL677_06635 [Bdellovibrionaceae bacterium]|nr:hypothetical protein [Pseudobdellovibrionaceae bacterium]|tara:strand:+ start:98926 stop:99363 length:438 start_codon:yes stop_codon:yes gene_type:complete
MIIDLQAIGLATLGGIIIGLSVTVMLLFSGRVTGISGITYGILTQSQWKERAWRLLFFIGLLVGGVGLSIMYPSSLENTLNIENGKLVIAGLLVGFGTVLGNGCTSGHGVCGISRFSLRSITATGTFMVFGMIAVFISRHFLGGF